jgi:hypothetical protein
MRGLFARLQGIFVQGLGRPTIPNFYCFLSNRVQEINFEMHQSKRFNIIISVNANVSDLLAECGGSCTHLN